MGIVLAGLMRLAWAQCPDDPYDRGICDTMYVEAYGRDTFVSGGEKLIRLPIRVTHDVPNPAADSLAAFVIPLIYWHTNPGKYCSLSSWRNRPFSTIWPPPPERCIFRHLPDIENPTEMNWMWSLAEQGMGQEWDAVIVDLDGTSYIRLAMIATGLRDQLFWEGSRVLLATMTFEVEDTMTVCIDSCFWPPSSYLDFGNSDATGYVPRHNLPYCFSAVYNGDCNHDGATDIGDVAFVINYLFKSGPAPDPYEIGELNCDGIVDLGDVITLLHYLYLGSPLPECP